ncbi:ferredoxin--NADP reductase [Urechidicola croceus]|uniref:Flavodoxin reductase n=1 Tax=Urechidicola croceus TaxID=1850246 RepID=A0A1D8P943_9FLAO|nr:ferredoxin--NADP reductase [Urechidicola croceus]AOW21059.1 flavodoxin reductase [Urechidicola croceus]
MAQFHNLTIKEIIKETNDAVSISFNIPNDLKSEFQFIAGQYITIKKKIAGKEVRRAYSICSTPESGEVKIAVKAVDNGIFSVFATTLLKNGDSLEVSKPEGRFTLTPNNSKNYIAFAAGSGITPVLSMIKSSLNNGASFTLIYGNKTVTDTIFKSELDNLKEKYPNNFNLHYIYSREDIENALFGRIDTANVNYFLKNIYKNSVFSEAFLCGPEKMIETVTETLINNNMQKENIHFELFSTPVDNSEKFEIAAGNTEITVVLDDEETTFVMSQKQPILNAALDEDLDAPYSCQGGVCSSCLARITEGKAIMEKNSILTDSEIEEGLILTCQAHPTTPKITIDYDDV